MTSNTKKRRPAINPEVRENQLVSMAVDLAEKQLREGTASAQVITHFLRLGTVREKVHLEKMRKESELLEAKRDAIRSGDNFEQVYRDAIEAMRMYSGNGSVSDAPD